MRMFLGLFTAVCILFAGCGTPVEESTSPATAASDVGTSGASGATDDAQGGDAGGSDSGAAASAEVGPSAGVSVPVPDGGGSPVRIENGKVALTPENTYVRFVCVHMPPKEPDPRTGTFEKFSGEATVADFTLKSLQIEFDATSIWTNAGEKLTNHLKSPDFFDVREYPTAKFESTKIEGTGEAPAKIRITGNLTLHGQTKEITIPATVQFSSEEMMLQTLFSINRSEFGMTYGPDAVDDVVKIAAIVGHRNK